MNEHYSERSPNDHNLILAKLRAKYFSTERDTQVADHLETCLELAKQRQTNPRIETRGLILLAPSGAGKSQTIKRALLAQPVLQAEDGKLPCISLTAPSPCTLKLTGRKILTVTQYEVSPYVRENDVWDQLRKRLQALQTLVVHIDETNNLVSTANVIEKAKIIDTLKGFLNDPTWPVVLVLSGTPDVKKTLQSDAQLRRRMNWMELKDLDRSDFAMIAAALEDFCKTASLSLPIDFKTQIIPRLVHAADKAFGLTLELSIETIGVALKAQSATLTTEHFATRFAQRTGCDASQNPFVANKWWLTNPKHVL